MQLVENKNTKTKILYGREFIALRNRMDRAIQTFKSGGMILIGDDGRRENEIDIVFHASFADAEKTNFALKYARGLLCVSIGNTEADRMGFASAPKLPGGMAHTGFTLSVDARENIGSGISASDRAHTIKIMADGHSSGSDFISPGHVFPVRANDGGILARSGHTEAVAEVCKLANLPAVAIMCEILGDDGEALKPDDFLSLTPTAHAELFRQLPFVSTVDLLWYRVFFGTSECKWISSETHSVLPGERKPKQVFELHAELEDSLNLTSAIFIYSEVFDAKKLRISLNNGTSTWDNGVSKDNACAELYIFSFADIEGNLEGSFRDFCDLSRKEGLCSTQTAIRRVTTELRAIQFLSHKFETSLLEIINQISLPVARDKEILLAAVER